MSINGDDDLEMYEVSADEDDSAMENWVDGQLAAEGVPALDRLDALLDASAELQAEALPTLIAQAEAEAVDDESGEEPVVDAATQRAAIRKKIMDRIKPSPTPAWVGGDGLDGVARNPTYENEDTQRGAWRSAADPTGDAWVTEYADRSTLTDPAQTRWKPGEGRVVDASGTPVDGKWGWVIDAETGVLLLLDPDRAEATNPQTGEVRIVKPGEAFALLRQGWKIRATHHTTLVAGFPVAGAGLVTLEQGYIAELTDQSGHYRPDAEHIYQSVEHLAEQGYSFQRPGDEAGDFRDARIQLTGRDAGFRPTDKAPWLDEAAQANPYFPTDDMTLRSEQFRQTEGNERQIRMKEALNREFQDKRAGDLQAATVETTHEPDASAFYSVADPGNYVGNYSGDNQVIYPEDNAAALRGDEDNYNNQDDAGVPAAPQEAAPPPQPSVTWEQIDWGFVSRANEQLLKDTLPGGALPYWQAGAGLIIGNEQPATYRRLFEQLRGGTDGSGNTPTGYIRVRSRGGVTSRGEIEVTGGYDRELFKASIRDFSKKEIRFI